MHKKPTESGGSLRALMKFFRKDASRSPARAGNRKFGPISIYRGSKADLEKSKLKWHRGENKDIDNEPFDLSPKYRHALCLRDHRRSPSLRDPALLSWRSMHLLCT